MGIELLEELVDDESDIQSLIPLPNETNAEEEEYSIPSVKGIFGIKDPKNGYKFYAHECKEEKHSDHTYSKQNSIG